MSSAGEVTPLIERTADGAKVVPRELEYEGAILWDFDVDRAVVKPNHIGFIEGTFIPFLDRLANDPEKQTKEIKLFIVGNCSRTGSWEHNQVLSMQRAANVASFFHGIHYSVCAFTVGCEGHGKMAAELWPSPWAEYPLDRNVCLGVGRVISVAQPQPVQRDTKEFRIRARVSKTLSAGIGMIIHMDFDVIDVEREMYTPYSFYGLNLGWTPPWEADQYWTGVGQWNNFTDDMYVQSCDFGGAASWWPQVSTTGHAGVGDAFQFTTTGRAGTKRIFPFTITPGPYELSMGIRIPITGNMSPSGGERPMKHWIGPAH
jgi:hypothetical protein